MKIKVGELDKGEVFIKRGIWYRKLSDKWSGRTTEGDGNCSAMSQHNQYQIFGNNTIVEIEKD